MRTKLAVACAALAVVAVAGGSAEATGLIHTSNIANGAVTFDKFAPAVQKLVSQMPKNGVNGLPGAPGAIGPAGPAGATGLQGPKGDGGPTGPQGDTGPRGLTGAAGAPGIKGDTGAKGATGAQGPQGDPGVQGAQGAKGDAGAKGDPGVQGNTGPQGPAGLDSDDARAVTTSNLAGFVLAPDGDNTPAFGGPDAPGNGTTTFVAASDAPLGSSALDMHTITGKSVAVFLPAAGAKGRLLSELTSFGYASKVISQVTPDDDVTAQIEVTGSTATHFHSGYTTVVFEPYVNGEAGVAGWHRSDLVHGKVWSTQALPSGDCSQAVPCAFSTFIAENPAATVLDAKFRIGQNSGTPAGDGGEYLVDDLVYGFGTVLDYDLGA